MAKAKTKSSGKVSAGMFANVSKTMRKSMRADYMQSFARTVNQLKAHKAGKRVMVTIANPNKNERNKPFIRVPSTQVWREYKYTPGS